MGTQEEIEAQVRALGYLETCSEAQQALIESGAPAIRPLVKALGDQESCMAAAEALTGIGAAAVEPLVRALGSENKRVSAHAAIALEDIGRPAVDALITALASHDRRKLVLTIRALGEIGDDRAVGPLRDILDEPARHDRKGLLVETTVEALDKLGVEISPSRATELLAAAKKRRSRKSEALLQGFVEALQESGFEADGSKPDLYYHARVPKMRFVIRQRVIRLERRRDRWQLVRSFSIARETQLALEAADALLKDAA